MTIFFLYWFIVKPFAVQFYHWRLICMKFHIRASATEAAPSVIYWCLALYIPLSLLPAIFLIIYFDYFFARNPLLCSKMRATSDLRHHSTTARTWASTVTTAYTLFFIQQYRLVSILQFDCRCRFCRLVQRPLSSSFSLKFPAQSGRAWPISSSTALNTKASSILREISSAWRPWKDKILHKPQLHRSGHHRNYSFCVRQ